MLDECCSKDHHPRMIAIKKLDQDNITKYVFNLISVIIFTCMDSPVVPFINTAVYVLYRMNVA